MKQIICIIFILGNLLLGAQNLVPNGSFEILSSCPTGGTHSSTLCVNWYNPTQAGTPDAYSVCGGDVPSNGVYYQWPRTGNSFAGIWCYTNAFTNLREYLHTNLNNTLIVNNYYLIKFYTTLNDWSKYACNNLGLYFSNSAIYQSGA
ncbi:MAG: hypothetical protein KBE91_11500, partial [Bacteroidia bacterium]|nr:hypothetical protein [Bacteroidia bacterium]